MKTLFVNYHTITELQIKIMKHIDVWARTEKVPISQKEIVKEMEKQDENKRAIVHAIDGLLRQGYIRRAIAIGGSQNAKYVQLRRL